MDQGLGRYTQQVTHFAQELDEHTGKAVNNLAGAAKELHQVIEDLLEALPETRR